MLTKIVERLKTGTIKNVIPFGSLPLPAPPYIVVKPEKGVGGRSFRIIVHMLPGQQIFLEDYVRETLITLLDEFTALSRHGALNMVDVTDEWADIFSGNSDGTISMERVFLMPSMSI